LRAAKSFKFPSKILVLDQDTPQIDTSGLAQNIACFYKFCYSYYMMEKAKRRELSLFSVELDREEDGRWIAEIAELPGVMAYGNTKQEAIRRVYAIALRTLADNVEQGATPPAVTRLFEHEVARR
jgi:predicted RNase H-like HicB family nuclease